MIEFLLRLDLKLLLLINSLHNPFLDSCMLLITHRNTWIPLYIGIIIFLYFKRKKDFYLIILCLVGATICSDLFASSFMKPYFHRLRPCHNGEIAPLLYLIKNKCGGNFGFISSHAANTFALSTFLYLYLRKTFKWISIFFLWAFIVSISRVYLGVHYPADVTVGAISGVVIAALFYFIFLKIKLKLALT